MWPFRSRKKKITEYAARYPYHARDMARLSRASNREFERAALGGLPGSIIDAAYGCIRAAARTGVMGVAIHEKDLGIDFDSLKYRHGLWLFLESNGFAVESLPNGVFVRW